ncbi:MAG: alpha-hydroxy-acid oxidizing protein [Salinigranum sp.]
MSESTGFLDRRRRELMRGERAVPLAYDDLREEAERHLREEPMAYTLGAAGGEGTVEENRRALARYRILPRALCDVSSLDLSVEFLGRDLPGPLLLAPIGTHGIYHEDGELATARAAAELGVPFTLASSATRTIEEVAEAMGSAPRLLQLYWPNEWDVAASYVERAEAAGYDAIVLTVDAQTPRWRPRILGHGYRKSEVSRAIPESDPVVERLAAERGQTVEEVLGSEALSKDRSLTWEDLSFLRDHTDLPIVLKGVLNPEDARKAVEYADGIVVSNHGGRQIDGEVGAATMLPRIVDAVGGEIPVVFDSGVRGGADVFKALALGADAVMLGRPYAFGLAIAGQRGVREVIENYLAEFESVLGQSGYDAAEAVGREAIVEP